MVKESEMEVTRKRNQTFPTALLCIRFCMLMHLVLLRVFEAGITLVGVFISFI